MNSSSSVNGTVLTECIFHTIFGGRCRCTHLTAFGSMMDVAPNPIDFSAVMDGFSSMFETGNVTVFFFVLVIFLIYVLVLVWARRADKKDLQQVTHFLI